MNVQRRFVTDGEVPGYDDDFLEWCDHQTLLLQRGDATALDWENLAEEIRDMAGNLRSEIKNRLRTIIGHMLKIALSTASGPRAGWRTTIREQRERVADRFEQSPSLWHHAETVFDQAYASALKLTLATLADHEPANADRYRRAAQDLPEWTLDQVLDEDFFPEPPREG